MLVASPALTSELEAIMTIYRFRFSKQLLFTLRQRPHVAVFARTIRWEPELIDGYAMPRPAQ